MHDGLEEVYMSTGFCSVPIPLSALDNLNLNRNQEVRMSVTD